MKLAFPIGCALLLGCGAVNDQITLTNAALDRHIQQCIDTADHYTKFIGHTIIGYTAEFKDQDTLVKLYLTQGAPSSCRDILGYKRYGNRWVYFIGDSLPTRYMTASEAFDCDPDMHFMAQEILPDPPFADILYFNDRHFYRRQLPEKWSSEDDNEALPLILVE